MSFICKESGSLVSLRFSPNYEHFSPRISWVVFRYEPFAIHVPLFCYIHMYRYHGNSFLYVIPSMFLSLCFLNAYFFCLSYFLFVSYTFRSRLPFFFSLFLCLYLSLSTVLSLSLSALSSHRSLSLSLF